MRKTAPGQALLILILVMAVGLTVGLSLSTRSVSDLKVSGQTEDSSRAFSAAEAGIEAALKGDTALSGTVGNGSYALSILTAGGNDSPFPLGDLAVFDTYTVWLVGHNAAGDLDWATVYAGNTIDLCWQKAESGSPEPAMEATVLYKDLGNVYKIWRGAYDSDAVRRAGNFFAGTDSGTCAGLANKKTINLSSLIGTKIALRLRPFYAKASVSVAPLVANNLPGQGLSISSVGTSGQTTRKVLVTQSYASLPPIFDYVLFSGKDANK